MIIVSGDLFQKVSLHLPIMNIIAQNAQIFFCSQIEPTFFSSMCIGHMKPHKKFQGSGLNILNITTLMHIKIAFQNGITLWKHAKMLFESWQNHSIFR